MSLLEKLVQPTVLANTAEYAEQFQQQDPFRNVVIDDFFDNEFCQALIDQFPTFDDKAALNENGEVGAKAAQERVTALGSSYRKLNKLAASKEFRSFVSDATGIADLQYDPYYFGGGTHENRQGQDLDAHVDFNFHPITKQHRRLNLIVYFNDEWDDAWGGSLDLHRDPYLSPAQDQIKTVTPLRNRCVVFETTESSWHGFTRIDLPQDKQGLSRKSFALYYYTDTRPPEEIGKPHSTIYVERHLPERYQAGHTLNDADTKELKVLLARRDQHLKRLYNSVTELTWRLDLAQANLPAHWTTPALDPIEGSADEQLHQLRQVIQAQQAELAMLRGSRSWRLTAPLRGLRYRLGSWLAKRR